MMIGKWIGAICIFTACASVGFSIGFKQIREIKMLEQWIRISHRMEKEIGYYGRSIPDLFRMISYEEKGELAQVFLRTAIEMENQIHPDASRCMSIAIAKTEGLPSSILELLDFLGNELGKYNLDEQLKGIAQISEIAVERRNLLCKDRVKRMRGYQTLGLCAGAALVILFI